ncbi:MAG: hypothetical protein LBT54_07540 [Bifidobacteriaceae bacterium]|nr:hypothetical protein [Bifidobacteriaceae bacterium]
MTTRRRALTAAALLAGIAMALTGCMKMDAEFSVRSDDTVDGSIVIATEDAAMAALDMTFDQVWAEVGDDAFGDAGGNSQIEDYAQDGYTGKKILFSGTSLADFGSDDMGTQGLAIEHVGDEFVVNGVFDMSEGMEDAPAASVEMAATSLEVTLVFVFPGEVIEASGEVDGNRVTWKPVIGEATDISIRAVAIEGGQSDQAASGDDAAEDGGALAAEDRGASGGVSGILIAALAILAAALIAIVVVILVRSRKAQAGAAPVAPGGYPGQPIGYPAQPGVYPGQPGVYPGQAGIYPGQPGPYPGQPAAYPAPLEQPGTYPAAGQPGQFPAQPVAYPPPYAAPVAPAYPVPGHAPSDGQAPPPPAPAPEAPVAGPPVPPPSEEFQAEQPDPGQGAPEPGFEPDDSTPPTGIPRPPL